MNDKLWEAMEFQRGQIGALELLMASILTTLSDQQRTVVSAHLELAMAGVLNASVSDLFLRGFDATKNHALALNPETDTTRRKSP